MHWNGGRLDVTNDASVMYTPRPNNDLLIAALSNADDGEAVARKLATSKPEALGSYLMRHNADVCCEALDHEGNVFQVGLSILVDKFAFCFDVDEFAYCCDVGFENKLKYLFFISFLIFFWGRNF